MNDNDHQISLSVKPDCWVALQSGLNGSSGKKTAGQHELQQTREQLETTVKKLKEANHRILEQQRSLIEEERLKVLLQMAGASAEELDHPLMTLQWYFQLLEMDDFRPELMKEMTPSIIEKIRQVSQTIRKIQTIDLYEAETEEIENKNGNDNGIGRLEKDMRRAMKKMADLSILDQLTGLYNRRYMIELIDKEFSRASRYDMDLSCVLLDLDLFKQINDNFGHPCGDRVLTDFAKRILQNKRRSDFAFRYGGEEFLLLLPQTDGNGAMTLARNLLDVCRNEEYRYDEHAFVVTMSAGIAERKACGAARAKDLIAFADKALYRAKADGRNCIRLFRENNPLQAGSGGQHQGSKGLFYFKEQMAQIVQKSKKAAITSLDSLIHGMGGVQLDEETRRTCDIISSLCKKLHFPESITGAIKHAASLHNGFKLILGDEILSKQGALTDENQYKIHRLPYIQVELANQFDFFSAEKSILRYQNERIDGTGYPEGLEGDEIPFGARVFSVANALVSMTSDRAHRSRFSDEEALLELVRNAGTQFDRTLVYALLDVIDETGLLKVSHAFISERKKELEPV